MDSRTSALRVPFKRLSASAAVLVAAIAIGLVFAAGASAAGDLSITKIATPTAAQGGNITYTITVNNAGPVDPATAVVVTDPLPSQVDYVSSTTTAGNCVTGNGNQKNTVTCSLGTIPSGGSAVVTIIAKASKSGTASNTATVASTPADPNGINNTSTATTTITAAPGNGKGNKKNPAAGCATPTITGTLGDDVLVGTAKADIIVGLSGNDTIVGNDGNDIICSGSGNDVVSAGAGSDFVSGGVGFDRIYGSIGNDLLKGKANRDRIFGNAGNDRINGGTGRDKCRGGKGRDTKKNCP